MDKSVIQKYAEEYMQFAEKLSDVAGEEAKKYFGREIEIEKKSDLSPVTIADKNAESRMREMIEKKYPTHGIYGEEFGEKKQNSEFRWFLDPIDGTKSFIHGVPLFGCLAGLEYQGTIIAGAVAFPALGIMISAGMGLGAQSNKKKCAVSKVNDLKDALVCASSVNNFYKYGKGKSFESLLREAGIFRTWGDAYGYYLVATGQAEVMIDPVINPWDIAPFKIILPEAGGVSTDWQNKDDIFGKDFVGSNSILHGETLRVLAPQ